MPYPHADVNTAQYYLDYASTKEILVEVGLSVTPDIKGEARTRPTAFQLGLSSGRQGCSKALARGLLDAALDASDPDQLGT